MAVFYCQVCDRYIDLDWDVEHYDRCPTLEEEEGGNHEQQTKNEPVGAG